MSSLVLFLSCQSEVQEENESLRTQIDVLKKENERLRNKSDSREISVSEYQRTLEEIDYNLRTIELNLNQVSSGAGRAVPVKERIESRIAVIQKLIHNSNLKIKGLDENLDELRRKSQNRGSEVLALERVMKNAAQVLINKEDEFNQKIAALELDESVIGKTYEEQLAITYELYKIINRAYFLKASLADLKDLGIVDADRGFVGIATVKILNATNTNNPFEEIEKDKKSSFVFDEEQVKLISIHPQTSYTIKKMPSKIILTIKDRKSFWQNGNYLIVQAD